MQRQRLRLCEIDVPHVDAGRLENELRGSGFVMANTSYEAKHTVLRIALPDNSNAIADAQARVGALTAGAGRLNPRGTEWIDVP